jgi:hypothetical protein
MRADEVKGLGSVLAEAISRGALFRTTVRRLSSLTKLREYFPMFAKFPRRWRDNRF